MIILDTNVVSELMRPEPAPQVANWVRDRDRRELRTTDQKMAWMLILATIPVGLVGLFFEHKFRVLFGKPVRAAIFLVINGVSNDISRLGG